MSTANPRSHPELPSGHAERVADCYSVVSRAVGCLAGMMLLVEAAPRFTAETIVETIHKLDPGLRDASRELRELSRHSSAEPHVGHVLGAAECTAFAATTLERSLRVGGGGVREAERALPSLRRAYQLLRSTHDPEAGMTLLDFGHACGGCHRPSDARGGESDVPILHLGR